MIVTAKFAAQEMEASVIRSGEGYATVMLAGSTQPRRLRVVTSRERFDATDAACVLIPEYQECPVCLLPREDAHDPEHEDCLEYDAEYWAGESEQREDFMRDEFMAEAYDRMREARS